MKHQVIVIGGGVSGLAACVELLELGLTDIVLVEATDRLGGRIRTVPFRNIFVHNIVYVNKQKSAYCF